MLGGIKGKVAYDKCTSHFLVLCHSSSLPACERMCPRLQRTVYCTGISSEHSACTTSSSESFTILKLF